MAFDMAFFLSMDLCYPVVAVLQRTLVDFVAGGKEKQAGGGDFALIVVVRNRSDQEGS